MSSSRKDSRNSPVVSNAQLPEQHEFYFSDLKGRQIKSHRPPFQSLAALAVGSGSSQAPPATDPSVPQTQNRVWKLFICGRKLINCSQNLAFSESQSYTARALQQFFKHVGPMLGPKAPGKVVMQMKHLLIVSCG